MMSIRWYMVARCHFETFLVVLTKANAQVESRVFSQRPAKLESTDALTWTTRAGSWLAASPTGSSKYHNVHEEARSVATMNLISGAGTSKCCDDVAKVYVSEVQDD